MQRTAELMKLISGESEEIPQDVRDLLNEIEKEKKEQSVPMMTEDEVSSDIEHPQVPGEEGEALGRPHRADSGATGACNGSETRT